MRPSPTGASEADYETSPTSYTRPAVAQPRPRDRRRPQPRRQSIPGAPGTARRPARWNALQRACEGRQFSSLI